MLGMILGRFRSEAGRRAARLRAVPHWIWPLGVCAVFIAVGLLVLDDYAVTDDSVWYQRPIAIMAVDFVRGDADALPTDQNKYYGVAFEVLPLLVERIAGLDDPRAIYLTRHLMTHLLFIAGGFCGYLLAYRMTGSRLLGLLAMLLFLLHPRIYAHSFFNSKDAPFLSMFMIALLGVHWAFRKGTVGAFLLCGAAVGILVNLRIMGVMLLPAVLAMRACDVYYAADWAQRRRVISSGAAFALAATVIYYASMPWLWADPIARFGELVTVSSRFPEWGYDLFRGQYVDRGNLPALYLPVWIGITTPVWALLLAGMGAAGICGSAMRRAGAILRNTELRFELLLVAGAALPIAAVIAWSAVMYNGWAQLYFLWAPLCLLAIAGLQRVGGGLTVLTHHCRDRWHPALALVGRAAPALALAAALAVTTAELIRLHPYQNLYFNRLVDRNTPEYLKTQYEMDYFNTGRLEGYRYILDHHPGATIQQERRVSRNYPWRYLEPFTAAERRRLRFDPATDADYYVINPVVYSVIPPWSATAPLPPPTLYSRAVYHNTIMSVATPDLSRVAPDVAEGYWEIYRAAARQEPALRADFDFYRNDHDRTLTLVNEDCPPGALSGAYWLRIYPADAGDLRRYYQRRGYLEAQLHGVRFDGKCLMQATLPDYEIARIVVVGVGEILSDGYRAELRQEYDELRATAPAIQSDFAVYVEDGELRYVRDKCRPADTAAEFFLHLIPADLSSLPADRREYGYGNYDFSWDYRSDRGKAIVFDDKCMATVELPDYELHGIRTGQYVPGEGRLWGGEFYTAAYQSARAAQLAAQTVGAPAAPGFFSVWHSDGVLTYIREDCAAGDTAAAFYLHLTPVAVADLPEGRREHGFDNRDFEFGAAGGVEYAGRCLVSVPLPDYAIASIRTGQYTPGDGRLWAAEFEVE